LLVGRDDLIEEFVEAIENGPGASGRATLYTGPRGAGKTVLLNAIEDRTKARGWLVVTETASPGFVERITRQHLPRLLRDFDPETVHRHLSGLSLPLGPEA
jgi:ABC-type branched-subunit amino acid transport system ATPase component